LVLLSELFYFTLTFYNPKSWVLFRCLLSSSPVLNPGVLSLKM